MELPINICALQQHRRVPTRLFAVFIPSRINTVDEGRNHNSLLATHNSQ
jgi:hypothetical protein